MKRGIVALIVTLIAAETFAASNTAVLPKGIWHPSVRFGYVSELSNRYDNSGQLQSVGRLNQPFSGESIGRYHQDFKAFTDYLKQTFPFSDYANQISIGALEFDANADIFYTAPVMAYGLTKRLSVGIGIPLVTLQAQVSYQQTGVNNSKQICDQIAAEQGSSPQLDQGCQQLQNTDLVAEFRKALTKNGYEVPTVKNQSVMGDIQLAAVYQYFETKRWIFWEQTILNLPTGPEDDPDDFLDIPVFHQTALKVEFHQDYRLLSKWTVGSLFGYNWKIQDTSEKRVPRDEADMLPPPDRKERLSRDLGDIATVGGYTNYWLSRVMNLNVGYDYSYKGKDVYSGSRGYDYSVMSKNTESNWHRISGGFTASTIDLFLAQEFPVPFQVSYLYSDILAGSNIDRQMAHEFSLKMFF